MTRRIATSAAIGLLVTLGMTRLAPAAGEKDAKTEVEGGWKLTKGGKGAPKHLAFKGKAFVLKFDDDGEYKGTFKLVTTENPSLMDLKFESGPDEKYKGKTALFIYEFDGDVFRWCSTIPGSKRRPLQFVETMGDVRLLLGEYQKDKGK